MERHKCFDECISLIELAHLKRSFRFDFSTFERFDMFFPVVLSLGNLVKTTYFGAWNLTKLLIIEVGMEWRKGKKARK